MRKQITVLLTPVLFTVYHGEPKQAYEARCGRHFHCSADRSTAISSVVEAARLDDPATPPNIPIVIKVV